jgi:hypothetical protein
LVPLAGADVELTAVRNISLDSKPLDIATTVDGKLVYLLMPGTIQVYNVVSDRVTRTIPVDGKFDRITVSLGNTMVLSSSTDNTLQVLKVDLIQNIDISGRPYKGPAQAPVVIAIFEDYQ